MVGQKYFLIVAAVYGATGVAAGAFGAHGLKDRLGTEMLSVFEVGVRYHMYHAIAMLALAAGTAVLWQRPWAAYACWCWAIGVLIFSGSLYLLSLTEVRWLGAITPIGGVLLILGWCFAAASALSLVSDAR